LQAAAFRAQLQRREARSVVQINTGIAQDFDGVGEKRPFVFLELAAAQAAAVNTGFLSNQAL